MTTHVMYAMGTWWRALNLARALGRRGHSVTIVRVGMQRWRPLSDTEGGVTIWQIPRFWGSSLFHLGTRMPWDLAARIAMQVPGRFDVVHGFTHHLNSLLPTLAGKVISRRTVVVGDRDDLWSEGGLYGADQARPAVQRMNHGFLAWTEREMGRWIGTMTVVSDDLERRVVAAGAPPGRVRKIINGCPVDTITPGDRIEARRALGLPQGRPIALFVGIGQYDIDLILNALVILGDERGRAALPLTVLVGPHEERLRAMAAERGLGEHVIATGFLDEKAIVPYLRAADVGLLPFADKPLNWARFPIKLGDYLAAGLPVLTNAVGEIGALVSQTASGEVTAPDARAYAAGLGKMLSDRAGLDQVRLRARAAAEKYSWNAIGRDLEAFYLDMGARG